MTKLTIALILMCSKPEHYRKFKEPDVTDNLAFVRCVEEMKACVAWNGSVTYCETLLQEL
jgi:hypothetical protein